jgi:hypothetical protein
MNLNTAGQAVIAAARTCTPSHCTFSQIAPLYGSSGFLVGLAFLFGVFLLYRLVRRPRQPARRQAARRSRI